MSICVLCVPFFISHRNLTELTEIISLDVNIFCAFRAFRVPLSDPLISVSIRVLCVPFLSHTELTELTEIIVDATLFLCFPCFLCALFLYGLLRLTRLSAVGPASPEGAKDYRRGITPGIRCPIQGSPERAKDLSCLQHSFCWAQYNGGDTPACSLLSLSGFCSVDQNSSSSFNKFSNSQIREKR